MSSLSTERPRAAGSSRDASEQAADEIAAELIGLLHRNAPAEEFAGRLAAVEALPDALRRKSSPVSYTHLTLPTKA